MNFFKKLWRSLANKKGKGSPAADIVPGSRDAVAEAPEKETQRGDVEEVKYLLSMENNVVHPADLMHPLCMAMVWHTKKPVAVSIQDIRLYTVYDKNDASFLGSFYAIENEGMYFGNIVGNSHIIACTTDAFRFEETDELFAPLKNDGKNIFVLVCRYECSKIRLMAESLKKFDSEMQYGEILREFADGTSFNEAYSECQSFTD